jgi:uncharacterized membrane protein YccF (DUF307 family)
VRTIGNILWLVLAGFWLAVGYVIAGGLCVVFIITIPLAVPAFRLAAYVIWPFGRTVVKDPERGRAVSAIANVIWIILFGWWLALEHIITGVVLCLTIIGIPLGLANIKLVPLAFAPYGKLIVSTDAAAYHAAVASVPSASAPASRPA